MIADESLNALLELEFGLTDWEVKFIESLDRNREENGRLVLSLKQRMILDAIYTEKVLHE